jgi:predicted DNA-binding transcriptional regulator YafY
MFFMAVPSIPDAPQARDQVRVGSSSSAGRAQLPRLLELIMAIQSDRFPNARMLAERCEVSRRTIYRDLDTLAAAGIPVHYRPDRQGYQLARSCAFQLPILAEKEALALLVLARQWKGGAGLDLIRHARDGALKLVQALPIDVRNRVLTQAEPVPDETNLTPMRHDRKAVHDAILDALAQRFQIRIRYRDPSESTHQTTKLSLYRLVLAREDWYVVGRSTLHRQVRVFRISWIEQVTPAGDPYTIPPRFNLERFLGLAWAMERGETRHAVWLRFSTRLSPEIREAFWHRSQRVIDLPDRRADLHLVIDGLDEILGWVLGFGDEVEVLAPPELRDRVHAVASRVVRIHAPQTTSPPEDKHATSHPPDRSRFLGQPHESQPHTLASEGTVGG